MDYSKGPPGWQPGAGQDPSRPVGFDNLEQYPMNPPPYSNPANPAPYQGPGDTSQPPYPQQGSFQYPQAQPQAPYPGQGGYSNPYPPQPQGGYQPPYPTQPQGYQNPYPNQPQGYQNPYPNQPQGFQNPYPNQPENGYQNPYPTQPGYPPQDDYQHQENYTEQMQVEEPQEKKKHIKFCSIIGGIVAAIIVVCIIISLSSSGSDQSENKAANTTKKPQTTRPTTTPEPKQEKLILENCTLVTNLTEFVKCPDLKNCRPMILSNLTDLPKEAETAKNATAMPDIDLPQDILDSIVDVEFTSDSKNKTDTKTVDATSIETSLNETADASDVVSNQTVDLSHLANCSRIYYCNASLICADGNFTSNDTSITAGTSRTIVYRRPGFSPIVPLIIPLPIPMGGSKFGKPGKKLKPQVPIGNPFKPSKGGFGGIKKG